MARYFGKFDDAARLGHGVALSRSINTAPVVSLKKRRGMNDIYRVDSR